MLARIRKIQPNTDLTPSDVDALIAYHRATFGDARMEGEGETDEQKAEREKAERENETPEQKAEREAREQAENDKPADGKAFTQAELDAILQKRLADERAKFARELQAEKDKAGKSEAEKAELDRQRAEAERDEARQQLAQERLHNAARDAALAAKANPERIAAVLRLADLDGCTDEAGNIEAGKVAKAIEKVLKDYPEFKAKAGAGKSGGELNGDTKSDPTLAEFKAMDYRARTALFKEKPDLYHKLSEQEQDEQAS